MNDNNSNLKYPEESGKGKMLRTVIIEDNTAELENVLSFLAQMYPKIEVVGTAGEINSGFELICRTQPDLLITDIQITGGRCYDLLKMLKDADQLNELSIIFMTGFHDFQNATEAFKYAAVDFLVKPFSAQDLQKAVRKVVKQHEPLQNIQQLELLLDLLCNPTQLDRRLAVSLIGGTLQMVELNEVIFLEAKGSMTNFYLKDSPRSIVANKNLGLYVETLQNNPRFFSISNNLLINLDYLHSYDHSEQLVRLKGHLPALYTSRQGGQRLRQHLTSQHSLPKTNSLKAFFRKLLGRE